MQQKLEILLIAVLSIGFITLLGHEMSWWGPKESVNVSINYETQRISYLDEVCEAYAQTIHRIWIDNPSYVEDVLNETDEFICLDSLMDHDWGDIFEFWSDEDSIAYRNNIQMQEIEADLYLKYYRQPDLLPQQPKEEKINPVPQYWVLE